MQFSHLSILPFLRLVARYCQRKLLIVASKLTFHSTPPFIGYNLKVPCITATDFRELEAILEPGDILLRGHSGYLDSALIRLLAAKGECPTPFTTIFTHVGIYVGAVGNQQRSKISAQITGFNWVINAIDTQRLTLGQYHEYKRRKHFDLAHQRTLAQALGRHRYVVHATAEGVIMEDLFSYAQGSYLALLRLPDQSMLGQAENRAIALTQVIDRALGKVGSEFDFSFNDIYLHHTFSCGELAYYCYKDQATALGLTPKNWAFAGMFFPRLTVHPSDFVLSDFKRVWKSASLTQWPWPAAQQRVNNQPVRMDFR